MPFPEYRKVELRGWKARTREWLLEQDPSPTSFYYDLIKAGYPHSYTRLWRAYQNGTDSLSFLGAIARCLGKKTWEVVREIEEKDDFQRWLDNLWRSYREEGLV